MPKGLRATSSAWLRPAWVPAAALVMSSVHAADLGLSAGTRLGSFSDGSIGLHVPPTRDFEHASDAARLAQTDDSLRQLPSAPPVPAPYESAGRKSYLIPALEIVGFDFLLNRFDNASYGCCDYRVSWNSIERNFHAKWVVDNDPFSINQLGHPYQGSIYHGFARSAGLSYWASLGYTFAGSLLWEIAGETTPPSKNDQVASGIGGSFLGEVLFRMAHLLYDNGGGLSPFWRDLAAAAISPPTGFNKLVFGDRFPKFDSHDPAYYSRLAVGVSGTREDEPGNSSRVKRTEGILDYSIDYGLPGKPGYTYTRPFDYFSAQATVTTAHGFESLLTRGLLIGKDYGVQDRYRGVWGLYASYDYISPQVYRVSSTALSLGTTGEWIINPSFALQGTALAGAGYANVGTLRGTGDRDYHYGVAPQALLALRLIYADKAALDLTGREYFVSDVASDPAGRGGHDNIVRGEATFTMRLYKQHAVAIKYMWNRRDADYPVIGNVTQSRSTLGIFYTLLGHDRFGAYDWR